MAEFFFTNPLYGTNFYRVNAMVELYVPVIANTSVIPEKGTPSIAAIDGVLYFFDGTSWIPIGSGSGTIPTLQQVTDSGNLTVTPVILTSTDGALDPDTSSQLEVNNTAGGGAASILMRTVNNTTAEGVYTGIQAGNVNYTLGGPGGGTFTAASLKIKGLLNTTLVDMLTLYPATPPGTATAQAIFPGTVQIANGTEVNHAVTLAQLADKATIYTANGQIGDFVTPTNRIVTLAPAATLRVAPTGTDAGLGLKIDGTGRVSVNRSTITSALDVGGQLKVNQNTGATPGNFAIVGADANNGYIRFETEFGILGGKIGGDGGVLKYDAQDMGIHAFVGMIQVGIDSSLPSVPTPDIYSRIVVLGDGFTIPGELYVDQIHNLGTNDNLDFYYDTGKVAMSILGTGSVKIKGGRLSGASTQPTTLDVDGVTKTVLFNLAGIATTDQITELTSTLDATANFYIYNGSDVSGTGTVIGTSAGDNTPNTLSVSAKNLNFYANGTPKGYSVDENKFRITSDETNITGALTLPIIRTTVNLALNNTHHTVVCMTASSTIGITLPLAASCPGRIYIIKRLGANAVTIVSNAASGDTIEQPGAGTSLDLTVDGQQVTMQSDGMSSWVIVQGYY